MRPVYGTLLSVGCQLIANMPFLLQADDVAKGCKTSNWWQPVCNTVYYTEAHNLFPSSHLPLRGPQCV